jgi:putative glycosyltransferase (TIGR04372 family)
MLNLVRCWLIGAAAAHYAAKATSRLYTSGRLLNLLFHSDVKARRSAVTTAYFLALSEVADYERLLRELNGAEPLPDRLLNRMAGLAHLRCGDLHLACFYFRRLAALEPHDYLSHRLLGRALMLAGDDRGACAAFERSVALLPGSVMAHQNYAARYDISSYQPADWELTQAGKLLAYDNLAQHAEELANIGRWDESMSIYERMLDYQSTIAKHMVLPKHLLARLAAQTPSFDPSLPVRILSYEWVTQVGHIGMLDLHAKMRRFGMLPPANYVVLAPKEKVVNERLLAYFESYFIVLRDAELIRDLFPYQRYFGESFIAVRTLDHGVQPWALAASRAQQHWCSSGFGPLLRLSDEDEQFGRHALRELGLPDDAWFVGLHIRERGFYGEAEGSAGDHRNSNPINYLEAIDEVLNRGGWVIRLGDQSMRRLPARPRLIDYARSPLKSAAMDVYLFAKCRLIIGTTSGLTTAAQPFGTPMLLVNCISSDCQFWDNNVHFLVKPIYDRKARRYLSLAETYKPPIQGLLVHSAGLNRRGYEVHENGSEDIRDAVRYKLNILDGRPTSACDAETMEAYRCAMKDNPLNFGAAFPVPGFLRAHPELVA